MTSKRSGAPDPGHSRLRVQMFGSSPKDRVVYKLNALGCAVNYRVHNHNIVNLERAIKERVFYVSRDGVFVPPPKPVSEKHFHGKMKQFQTNLMALLPKLPRMEIQEYPGKYAGKKRTIYQSAVDILMTRPISRKDAEITSFVKAEKINVSSKPDPAPRVIQPRNPTYTVTLGCYIKPAEKRIYKSIDKLFGGKTVAKGLNAEERGLMCLQAWQSFTDPVAVGMDASRFDQHIGVVPLNWEHSFYKYIFPHHIDDISKLLSWQLTNKCTGYCSDGRLKYTSIGGRMSGDVNTALGNVIIMCGLVYSYMLDIKICKYRLIDDGDDCVVIMEKKDLNRFLSSVENWFLNMGFTMKVEKPVYELEHIVFCQSQPVFDGEKYLMVRDPHTALKKDCCSIKPLDTCSMYRKWLIAVGDGGLSLTGGIPLWQNFYRKLARYGSTLPLPKKKSKLTEDPVMDTGLKRLAMRMERTFVEPTPETRYSFWRAFGITPDEQIAMEQYYDDEESDPIWVTPLEGDDSPLDFFPQGW